MRRFGFVKLFAVILAMAGQVWAESDKGALEGDWEGVLSVSGMELPLVIHLSTVEGKQVGTQPSDHFWKLHVPSYQMHQHF